MTTHIQTPHIISVSLTCTETAMQPQMLNSPALHTAPTPPSASPVPPQVQTAQAALNRADDEFTSRFAALQDPPSPEERGVAVDRRGPMDVAHYPAVPLVKVKAANKSEDPPPAPDPEPLPRMGHDDHDLSQESRAAASEGSVEHEVGATYSETEDEFSHVHSPEMYPDHVVYPDKLQSITTHFALEPAPDIEQELESFSRLWRLGHFSSAKAYFAENLSEFENQPYVLIQWAQFLVAAGDFRMLRELAKRA
jgi:hypothetical protein